MFTFRRRQFFIVDDRGLFPKLCCGKLTFVFILSLSTVATAFFEQADYSVSEADLSVQVCVVLETALARNLTISLFTQDSTAMAEDYQAMELNLTFVPDLVTSRTECVNISISADEVVEDSESFDVLIVSSDPVVFSVNETTVAILDDSSKSPIVSRF